MMIVDGRIKVQIGVKNKKIVKYDHQNRQSGREGETENNLEMGLGH